MGLSANEIGSIVFRIQAEDLASASLERIGASLNGLAEQSRLSGGAGGAFVDPAKAGESTAAVARVAEGTVAAGEAARESEGLFGTLGEKFRETAGEAAAFGLSILGIEAASGIFENLKSAIIDFPEQIDRARITFETFTGSGGVADDLLTKIEALSTSTPFSFTGLADAAKTLVALGTPADAVTGKLRDIAAAVAAVGGGDSDLRRIALTLARIQDAGTLTALTMRQLQTEQIPGWQILEDALGKTHDQIAQMLKTGQITSDVFEKAFDTWASTTAGTALAEQTNTISGSFNILTNAANLLTTTALAPLSEKLAEVASRMAQSTAANLPRSLDQIRSSNDLMLAGFEQFGPTMDKARERGDALGLALNILDGSFRAFGSDVQTVSGFVDGLFGKLVGAKEQLTLTGTKSADLYPGLDPSKSTGFDALTKASDGTVAAGTQSTAAFRAYSDSVTAAQPGVDALKLAVGELGNTFGLVAAEADKLTASQDALAAATTAKAAALTTENVDMLKEAIGQTGGPFALTKASAEQLATSADKAATAVGSIGQRAEASIPGLSAMDAVIFGTSQKLAAVQLQIEEKRLGRLESRPANSLGQQEALLQEQLKVEQLQRQVGFGGALAGLPGPKGQAPQPVTTGTKFKTGFASGGSFMVGGSGGTDSQLVQFWASPDETVSIAPPGGSYGGGGGATTISVASIFSGPVTITKEADEQRLVAAMTSAFRQFTAGGGRPQRARDRRSPGAQQ